jgi:hypothetical protein
MIGKNTQIVVAYLKYQPGIFLEGLGENHEALTKVSWSQGRDLKPGFPEQTAGQPSFRPKLSVMNVQIKVTDPDITYI